jgi:hypothetical protein
VKEGLPRRQAQAGGRGRWPELAEGAAGAHKADPEKRALEKQLKQLQAKVEARREVRALDRKLAALEVEHDLLKKAIRFIIERRRRSSSS